MTNSFGIAKRNNPFMKQTACDKKLGHKTNKTQIIYILNGKYIFRVSPLQQKVSPVHQVISLDFE
jgi:hypothetical protein